VIGFVCAIALAFLSVAKVSASGISYRKTELWTTTVRLLVTQHGAPEVRLYAQEPTSGGATTPGDQAARLGIPVADPGRFNTLAILYAELASSDPVRRLIASHGPYKGQVVATPLRDDQSGTLLPLIDMAAISTSPRATVELALRSAHALDKYVQDQQRANNVPKSDRAIIETIVQPKAPEIYRARSKTMAIVVFLVVMLAIAGLAFLLENLRPRVRALNGPTEALQRVTEQRRSA
jgi:hypothetical protein